MTGPSVSEEFLSMNPDDVVERIKRYGQATASNSGLPISSRVPHQE
jgi:hypothetical protein